MSERLRRPLSTVGRWLYRMRWLLGSLATLVVLLASVLVFPQRLIDWELGRKARTLNPSDLAKAINDVRTTLLQGIAGVVILLGVYFTYRQLQVNREGQITERFTRAIDHLGHAELDVRLGGIYALERIANDSSGDRGTIAEVLTAFVRGHAPWPPTPAAGRLTALHRGLPRLVRRSATDTEWPDEVQALQARAADVQAAMTVLGRRRVEPDGLHHLNLIGVDLRNARLDRAELRRAELFGANLSGAELSGANLQEARLQAVNLIGANLPHANLQRADLSVTRLHRAELDSANLQRADLTDADLQDAWLCNADLRGAHLGRAQLKGAYLFEAKLHGARADAETVWPEGFDWKAAGVVMAGGEPSSATSQRP